MPSEAGPHTTDPAVRATLWKATLPNGEQTIIPDTGAFESVTGAKLARVLTKDAVQHGARACIEKSEKPFTIGGVGEGTQSCHSRLNIDLAVPTTSGSSSSMNWTHPIVEGAGEGMRGLLGLNDLEKNRAILDIGGKRLIYPGPGDVTYNLPQDRPKCP